MAPAHAQEGRKITFFSTSLYVMESWTMTRHVGLTSSLDSVWRDEGNPFRLRIISSVVTLSICDCFLQVQSWVNWLSNSWNTPCKHIQIILGKFTFSYLSPFGIHLWQYMHFQETWRQLYVSTYKGGRTPSHHLTVCSSPFCFWS